MVKKIAMIFIVASMAHAQDFNPMGSYIACSNGADFHDSTSVRVDRSNGTVIIVEDGEYLGPYSEPTYDLFASGRLRVRFTDTKTNEEQTLRVNFMGESAEASLNDSEFNYSCFSGL